MRGFAAILGAGILMPVLGDGLVLHKCVCIHAHILLTSMVMVGQLPGNCSKLYPEMEFVKNTLVHTDGVFF